MNKIIKNKRGFLRIVEAIIAIVLIMGVLFTFYIKSRVQEEPDLSERARDILEEISRNSIKIFLELINDFDTKEKLHQMIDNSIYDLTSQQTFSKIFKKLHLKPTIIIPK